MPREIEEPTIDERGDEHHPAFAVIGAYHGSCGPPGASLFDSDIRHHHTVRIRIKAASRKRDLNHDWIHGGAQYIEVELSNAQWAAFVANTNSGDGVPCTLTDLGHTPINGIPFAPRLQESLNEVRDGAEHVFQKIQEARDNYEAVLADKTKKAADRREALRVLHSIREVIEIVITKARQLGYEPEELGFHEDSFAELGRGDVE